jgi:hypothetical protein
MGQILLNGLSEIGIDFRFGHTSCPAPRVSQVCWFRLASNTQRPSSDTYFWLEDESGMLTAFALGNLECQPEAIIPFLGGITTDACDEQSLNDHLQRHWLFPPSFHATQVSGALIHPTKAFLWAAIRQRLTTMIAMPDVSPTLARQIEAFLEACHKEVAEKYEGVVIERHALTPHHEASPSIEHLDEIAKFISMSQDFKGRLFEDIVALFDHYAPLLNARTHTIENYNTVRFWMDAQRLNRFQAIRSYPWLFHELDLRTGGPDYYHAPPQDPMNMREVIVDAIDRGQPLIPLLVKRYKVGKHTLRYAKFLLSDRYRIPETIPTVLWFLDGINPDLRPTTEADMVILNNAIDWISGWRHEEDREFVNVVASTLFQAGVAGFRSLIKRWCPSHNPDNPFHDVDDYLADYAQHTGKGLITQEIADSLITDWIREAGLLSLFAQSEQWHLAWLTRQHEDVNRTWPAILPESVWIRNFIVTELNTTEMLLEEGKAMRHCVGSYAEQCVAGKAFIFSVQTRSGALRSTVHIGHKGTIGRLIIKEHRGFANSTPSTRLESAADSLLQVVQERFSVYRERITTTANLPS